MGKIVVNKHFDEKSLITADKFTNDGEIIISNQTGLEGIFIRNKNGELLFIGPSEGSGSDIPSDYKEYISKVLEGYTTKDYVDGVIESISVGGVDSGVVDTMITSALTNYMTSGSVDVMITSALTNYVTKDEIGSIAIPEKNIRLIAAEEVAKIVDSADTSFDTLREIAEWITNDKTGAASMANDIEDLKSQLNAISLGAKAVASSSKSSIYKGELAEVTITGKMSPSSLTPCVVSIYKNGELLVSGNTSTVLHTEEISTTTTYNIKAEYHGSVYTANTTVNAYYPTYYGFGVNFNDESIIANKNLFGNAKRTYSSTANVDGVYFYLLVPNGVVAPSTFSMGGAPFNMASSVELIGDVNYTVFKSGSLFNNGGSVNIVAS